MSWGKGPWGHRGQHPSRKEKGAVEGPHSPSQKWCSGGEKIILLSTALNIPANVEIQQCHEIKRRLLLGRILTTNLDSVLRSRHITLATTVHVFKDMVFPVVMYGCESWAIKKSEC